MIRILVIIITFFTTIIVNAQEPEKTFQEEAEKKIRAEFPRARVLNFEYGNSFSRDFDSQLFDEDFQTGEIKNQKTFSASANIPIYKTQKWSLTGSANYTFNEFEFNDLANVSSQVSYVQDNIVDFHNFSAALSSTYFSALFKKPVIYNASVIVDGNEEGLERVKGFLGASLIMKRTARTTITLGAVVFIDPTSQIPFFPTFTYNHQFKNSQWELDFILPQRLLLRRPVGSNGRLSIGSTFGSSGFYVNVDAPNFPEVFEYSQLEVNSGLIYEHKLTHNVILTAKGGLTNFISSRLTEKGEPNKDFIYKNEQGATGYFNVGFSFDPFTKKN
tara:strand:+ start:2653 stop:3645 length:993 start_codon:yes stop_codon:yes gene_type:complete